MQESLSSIPSGAHTAARHRRRRLRYAENYLLSMTRSDAERSAVLVALQVLSREQPPA